MTSSIFRPRMSRAWPEPSTHLTASTMFVLPEPLGPTMAVTPPSNWISVCRAKVLKPSNCRDLKDKLAGRVADVGVNRPSGTTGVGAAPSPACGRYFPMHGEEFFLVDGFAELAAAGFGSRRLVVVAHRMQGDDLRGHGLLNCGRERLPRLARLARGPAGSPGLRLLGGRGLR